MAKLSQSCAPVRQGGATRDRQTIIARRKVFIASALAGIAATQCDNPFTTCLSPPVPPDAGSTVAPHPGLSAPQPSVCLSPVRVDASAKKQRDAAADVRGDARLKAPDPSDL